jgi:hypothetical protein
MLTKDSILTSAPATDFIADTVVRQPAKPQTPYQVLQLLPKDATPEQQDSAIQSWFQPGEIHYSEQPDTLHLPGHDKGHNPREIHIPDYNKERFLADDSLYHPELAHEPYGIAGDPIPYNISNDNVISSLLLGCFVMTLLAFAISKNFVVQQIKDFFYIPRREDIKIPTSSELIALFYFALQTCLLLSMAYFFYVKAHVADTFVFAEEYLFIGLLFIITLGYTILKYPLYTLVNYTFFVGKNNGQWLHTLLLLSAVEGALLFPAVLFQSYFDIPLQNTVFYAVFVLILVKILTFYKCFVIFFRKNGLFLQIILYFCTLEIIPLLALWGGLGIITNALTINY